MKSISSLFILIVYQLLLFTPHFTFAAPTQDRQELIDIFNQALADSRYKLTEGDVGEAATRLFGWEGCSASMKRDIYSGWQDSWKMMDAVKNINWNEAAAVDYLSPPFMHDDNQKAMQDIINTVSTIRGGSSLNPFKWWLHVRCDDPNNRCPCGSRTPTVAYTTQKDPESGYARINFCPRYFELPNLDAAVKENSRRDLPIAHRADLDNYVKNKGRTWYHELLHIDWASGVRSNWHIRDIAAFYKDEDNVYYRTVVYDAERTKALAHYKFDPAYFVRRNADNFAMYAMAKYVQKVVGKYPHLPLAMTFDDVEDGPGLFLSGGIIIDLQGKVTMAGATEDDSCHVPEIQDIPEEDVVPFNSSTWFWKTSDYPEDYQRQYRGWFADAYPYQNRVRIVFMYSALGPQWMTYADTPDEPITDFCSAKVLSNTLAEGDENDWKFPTELPAFDAHGAKGCVYSGTTDLVGEMTCESGASNIRCWEDPESREMSECEGGRYMLGIKCDWQ